MSEWRRPLRLESAAEVVAPEALRARERALRARGAAAGGGAGGVEPPRHSLQVAREEPRGGGGPAVGEPHVVGLEGRHRPLRRARAPALEELVRAPDVRGQGRVWVERPPDDLRPLNQAPASGGAGFRRSAVSFLSVFLLLLFHAEPKGWAAERAGGADLVDIVHLGLALLQAEVAGEPPPAPPVHLGDDPHLRPLAAADPAPGGAGSSTRCLLDADVGDACGSCALNFYVARKACFIIQHFRKKKKLYSTKEKTRFLSLQKDKDVARFDDVEIM